MTTVMKATDSAGFLGLLPALAGCTPHRSVVLLPFRGTRTHGALRLDLPDVEVNPAEFSDVALGAVMRVAGLDAVALVVYTDERPQRARDGLVLPRAELSASLLAAATGAGLRVVDALCVTPTGWACYLDETPDLRPLDEIPPPPSVPGIGDVSGDQLAGAALPDVDSAERARVRTLLGDLDRVLRHRHDAAREREAIDDPHVEAAADALDDLPRFTEGLLDAPRPPTPSARAALLWCLNRPALRDAMLVQWATDEAFGHRALAAQLAFSDRGESVPDALGRVFLGCGARPDADRLELALQAVRHAAASAPRDARPGALTAAAWLSWALGRSSHAGWYVDQALAIDPEHRMAALIGTLLSAALLPEWTLQRGWEADGE